MEEINPQIDLVPKVEAARCAVCGGQLTWEHDHRDDFGGLDDGPYRARKKRAQPSPDELSAIRQRAWATRRQNYGPRGHR